jgi:hypothetical protein
MVFCLVAACCSVYCEESLEREAQAQQPAASPTRGNQTASSLPGPAQQQSPAPSAPLNPQKLRSKVFKFLFPEERIDKTQMKIDSQNNSYRWTSNNEKGNTTCSICLERFQEGDLIISGGLCSHAYHRECVMSWVQARDDCPMCRQPMFDEAIYQAVEEQIIHENE